LSGSTRSFGGRLFGPGIGGAGAVVAARWHGDALEIDGDRISLRAPAADLQIEVAGFNLRQIRIGWRGNQEESALFVERDEDVARFLEHAPATLRASLQSLRADRRRVDARFGSALLVYALILLLPLILLLVFLLRTDSIAGWAAQKVPLEYEHRLGRLVLAQTRPRLLKNSAAQAAVQQIGGKLSAGSRYSYQWLVADADEINAFAAPGGIIVVNAGLIAHCERAEELAAVLAHEVAHVERRHALKNLFKSAGLSALFALAIGDWSGTALGAWAANLTQLKFSRDAEMEADRDGLQRLVRAGITPQPMADFFGRLARNESSRPGAGILATHPSSQQRMQALQAQIGALPARSYPPLDIDWPALRAALAAR
jgi:predicted Zn-dependent protease